MSKFLVLKKSMRNAFQMILKTIQVLYKILNDKKFTRHKI